MPSRDEEILWCLKRLFTSHFWPKIAGFNLRHSLRLNADVADTALEIANIAGQTYIMEKFIFFISNTFSMLKFHFFSKKLEMVILIFSLNGWCICWQKKKGYKYANYTPKKFGAWGCL